jgi:hypothetical protein
MRWYEHILRMNKDRIPKVLNMKVKGKRPRGRPRSKSEQHVRQYFTQKEGRPCEEIEEELYEDRDRLERLHCQMTHLKWKHHRRKKKRVHIKVNDMQLQYTLRLALCA